MLMVPQDLMCLLTNAEGPSICKGIHMASKSENHPRKVLSHFFEAMCLPLHIGSLRRSLRGTPNLHRLMWLKLCDLGHITNVKSVRKLEALKGKLNKCSIIKKSMIMLQANT